MKLYIGNGTEQTHRVVSIHSTINKPYLYILSQYFNTMQQKCTSIIAELGNTVLADDMKSEGTKCTGKLV